MLRAPADQALKGMRMCIHQPRKNRPAWKPLRLRQVRGVSREPGNLTSFVYEHGQAALKRATGVNEVGEPGCLGLGNIGQSLPHTLG
jgi:hypothetical protein